MDDHTKGREVEDALAECEDTVEHLKEENAQLRESAETFADLAERLNTRQRSGRDPCREPARAHQQESPLEKR